MMWRSGDGSLTHHRDLTNEHLINILNYIETRTYGHDWELERKRASQYDVLRCEAMRRGLKWRKFADKTLDDGELRFVGELQFKVKASGMDYAELERRILKVVRDELGYQFQFRGTETGRIPSSKLPGIYPLWQLSPGDVFYVVGHNDTRFKVVRLEDYRLAEANLRGRGVPVLRDRDSSICTLHRSTKVQYKQRRC